MNWSVVDFWSPNAQTFGGKVLELTVLHTDYYSHTKKSIENYCNKSILVAENTINFP